MEKYNCIIIEDEPLGAEILEGYIAQVPFLNLISVCNDAISAMNVLQKERIDLMFLDIHLPKIKGIDFLKTLTNPPKVIITSAYHQYALEGYEYNVLDYLLKPIEFSRFLAAVNKLNMKKAVSIYKNEMEKERPHMFFNMNKKKIKIFLEDILYIESQKEYVKIFTKEKSVITKMPLSQVHALLSKNDFMRIHRSFIISKKNIDAFNSTDIEIKGKLIPIGRSYKELVQSILKSMF